MLTIGLFLLEITTVQGNNWPKIVKGDIPAGNFTCFCQPVDKIGHLVDKLFTQKDLYTIVNGPGYAGMKFPTGEVYSATGLSTHVKRNWTMEYQPHVSGQYSLYKTVTINWAVDDAGVLDWGGMYSTVEIEAPAPTNSLITTLPCLQAS